MADAFISYSRKDAAFVRELKDRLEAQDREVWVDLDGIPPTAEWMSEIESAIEAAHGIVFVLSPNSLSSNVCRAELQHAEQHAKRLVPVLCADVDRAAVPASLSVLNWVVALTPDDMDAAVEQIITALDTDLEWVKAHTRQLTRATEWDHRSRDRSLLLRGRDLAEAVTWLQQVVAKEPRPTNLHREFIGASVDAAKTRRRATVGIAGLGLVIAVGLSALAANAARERDLQAAAADSAGRVAVAESLRADEQRRIKRVETANRLAIRSNDATGELRVPLALTAVRMTEPGAPTSEAKQALINALFRHADYPFTGIPAFSPDAGISHSVFTYPISFGPHHDGSWLFGRLLRESVRGWQICFGRPPLCDGEQLARTIVGAPTGDETRNSAVFSTNGKWFATTSDSGRVASVWVIDDADPSVPTFERRLRIRTNDRDTRVLAIGNDGAWLVMQPYRARHVELWNLSTTPPSRTYTLGVSADLSEVSAAAMSFEGRWVAVAAGRVGTRNAVAIWDFDALDGGPALELSGRRDIRSGALEFSPDDRWIVGGVQLWDFAEARAGGDPDPMELPSHGAVTVAFSPDSRWLVTGARARGNDKISTYLWDLHADDPRVAPLVLPHQMPSGDPTSITVSGSDFSRDGRWLATATTGSAPNNPKPPQIFIWPMRIDDWVAVACEVSGGLTEQQWLEHVQDEPHRALCPDHDQ